MKVTRMINREMAENTRHPPPSFGMSIIAAVNNQGVIGRDGKLPWDHIPADMSRFRRLTVGKSILMGRRTHQSIGRTLPDRNNIVLTGHIGYVANGCFVVYDFNTGLLLGRVLSEELVIIGGSTVYEQAFEQADKGTMLYLTKVDMDADGDTCFPKIDWKKWKLVKQTHRPPDALSPYPLTFIDAIRR